MILEDELRILKAAMKRAETTENDAMAAKLGDVINRLTISQKTWAVRSGDLLPREELHGIAEAMIGIIADELQDLPDYFDRVDRIVARIEAMSDDEPRLLEYREE